ncbi:MAG: complex I NDUFA9 subunit family protein [Steroidobacteraceae bacterium]
MRHAICVLGGTGYIGRALVARLAADGHDVLVLTRDPVGHRSLAVLPTVRVARADLGDESGLAQCFAGRDVVVNLVGILNERRPGRGDGSEFRRLHTELPARVARACRTAGVRRYLHMSGLNADATRGPSHYLRSKGEAEDHLRRECAAGNPDVVIFRPSVVFGPEDAFVNTFASMLRFVPVLPLACADARFAPVYVGDVVEAFVRALDRRDVSGRAYDLCGPEVVTLGEIVRRAAAALGLRRLVVPLPRAVARAQAALMDWVPGKPFSTDNFLSATVDSVSDRNGLVELGIDPTPMRGTVERYLRANFQPA